MQHRDCTLSRLSFSYAEPVLEKIDCTLRGGVITVFLGPSGCGKTTLLRLLSGLLTPESGSIAFAGDAGFSWSYLFQEPRLLPWLTVHANLDFVLRDRFPDEEERRERCRRFLAMVELTGAAGRKPSELSGGMRQRAAMARAFAWDGDGLLLDEPFQALDLRLKRSLISSFQTLWASRAARPERGPAVLVTHDLPEALLLGDEIHLLSDRPAIIRRSWQNPLPPEERRLDHPQLMELERELYQGFLG